MLEFSLKTDRRKVSLASLVLFGQDAIAPNVYSHGKTKYKPGAPPTEVSH